METKIFKIMILNWVVFLLSPFIVILINSVTLLKLVNIGSNMSGTYTSLWDMIIVLLYSLVLLCAIFFAFVLKPAKITKYSFKKSRFYKRTTYAYVFLVIVSLLFSDITQFSHNSSLILNIVAGLGFLWIIYLTFKAFRSSNQSFVKLQITSQIFWVLLLLNSFYGWNV